MMRRTTLFAVLAMTTVIAAQIFTNAPATAATITWNAFNITNDVTNVSTNGTLVEAISGDVNITGFDTVNGVTFAPGQIFDTTSNNDNIGSRGWGSTVTNTNYRELLRFASRYGTNTDATITFSGLTVGKNYEIQIWASDNLASTAGNSGVVLGDGTGVSPTFGIDTTLLYEVIEGGAGQYGTGTFKADATSQQLLLRRWNNLLTSPVAAGNIEANALQIRELPTPPVPEPSSLTLGVIGLMFLSVRRRRR